MNDELRIEMEPVGPRDGGTELQEAAVALLRRHPLTAEGDARVLRLRVDEPAGKEGEEAEFADFVAEAYDYINERAIAVAGPVAALMGGDIGAVSVSDLAYQPVPTDEEFDLAVEVARADERINELIERGQLQPYPPMPPVIGLDLDDGRTERVITVGLLDREQVTQRFFGVRLRDRALIDKLPELPEPQGHRCEPTPPFSNCPSTGTEGRVWVSVFSGGMRIWRFLLVRPAASTGTNGSGVELQFVNFRGRRVLFRAHVPILNIEYFDEGRRAGCGPTYRDWQNQETCFEASAQFDPVPGIRVCSAPARTIIESGTDQGNFRGAAIYVDGSDVVVVSELAAGWYRYISQWRLGIDGTIRPRFGFAATANTCTCLGHHHHVYWRLDLDIDGSSPNRVEEFNDPPLIAGGSNWHTKTYEIRRSRDPSRKRRWRVSNPTTGAAYVLTPGPSDGTATSYGVGDLWVLRYRGNEIDDGQGFTTDPALSRAGIDRFRIPAEPVLDRDVVLWYAAHFLHDEAHGHPGGHYVGPELRPEHWPA